MLENFISGKSIKDVKVENAIPYGIYTKQLALDVLLFWHITVNVFEY